MGLCIIHKGEGDHPKLWKNENYENLPDFKSHL